MTTAKIRPEAKFGMKMALLNFSAWAPSQSHETNGEAGSYQMEIGAKN
jgi:hypothetical protein